MMYLMIGLVIVCSCAYSAIQKSVPQRIDPFVALSVTYFTAALLCTILAAVFTGKEEISHSIREISWYNVALGIVLVGIEVGNMLAYRNGGQVSSLFLVNTVGIMLLLVPISIVLFKETITGRGIIGRLICLLGLLLVMWDR